MEKSRINFWQVVWFFSMDRELQARLIGPTQDQWFIEENDKNMGANYLKGLCFAFRECNYPDDDLTNKLRESVFSISQRLEPSFWGFESIVSTIEWAQVRSLACRLLEKENPQVAPPKRPFVIETMIHTDHYLHASEIRTQLGAKQKKSGKS